MRLYLWFYVKFQHPRTRKVVGERIRFQVDTGADETTVFNRDMEWLQRQCGLSYVDIPEARQWSRGVMGELLPSYALPKVTMTCQTAENGDFALQLPTLRAVEIPQRENNDPYACCALLGMDVLERFSFVNVDAPGNQARAWAVS